MRQRPDSADAFNNLGMVLHRQGKSSEARRCFEQAVRRAPEGLVACCNLASVLAETGESAAAQLQWSHAFQLDPQWPMHFCRTAWHLATHPDARQRHGAEALRLARQACQATENRVTEYLEVQAAALAECGQFREAVEVACKAKERADTAKVRRIEACKQRYEQGKPWRARS